jgi:alkaline phosphatase D
MSMSSISRRRFIKTVAIGTGAIALGGALSGCARGKFLHGVASGDPLQDRVVIWTRVTPAHVARQGVSIVWVVATDADCHHVIGGGQETTDADRDYTIKLDVTGLQPGRTYYYRFYANGEASPIGRMRTLPAAQVSEFKLAAVSCSNYPAGYFHAYAELAKRNDIDVVLHLGDYLYEYQANGYASEDAAALGRVALPETELLTLTDYRQRYAQYRTDINLQQAHSAHAFICVWDDHEVANDAWRDGAENHNPDEGDWSERKAQAIQAYYEWLPVREPEDGYRERLYRHFQVGDLLDLYMLDTRIIGRDQQLDYANYFDAAGIFDTLSFQSDMANPNRTLLGVEQRSWLQKKMQDSTATWQVMGQQVVAGRMNLPIPIVTFQVTFDQYQQLAALAQTNPSVLTPEQWAVLQAPSVPYNLDAWDGYFVERETLFNTARSLDKNVVILSGDTHNAWANNLATLDGDAVGVEFAAPSITSPGLEAYFPDQDPDVLAAGIQQLIEGLKYADLQHRGYMTVHFRPDQTQAEWHYVSTIKQQGYSMLDSYKRRLNSLPGADHRTIQEA